MSEKTAQKMMQVASVYGSKYELSSYLPLTALYELAAPKTPLEVREDVQAMLVDGQKVTLYALPLHLPSRAVMEIRSTWCRSRRPLSMNSKPSV